MCLFCATEEEEQVPLLESSGVTAGFGVVFMLKSCSCWLFQEKHVCHSFHRELCPEGGVQTGPPLHTLGSCLSSCWGDRKKGRELGQCRCSCQGREHRGKGGTGVLPQLDCPGRRATCCPYVLKHLGDQPLCPPAPAPGPFRASQPQPAPDELVSVLVLFAGEEGRCCGWGTPRSSLGARSV